jgi:hypothetical protein
VAGNTLLVRESIPTEKGCRVAERLIEIEKILSGKLSYLTHRTEGENTDISIIYCGGV